MEDYFAQITPQQLEYYAWILTEVKEQFDETLERLRTLDEALDYVKNQLHDISHRLKRMEKTDRHSKLQSQAN
ncbi:unnamed protein product [Cylicocyclus nassatus]|uniref:Uncharacterized protein n=1 Tax=Cylicocyclus nassatus TaxID=53992 RepID=A0AA36M9L5_CYLNA|nr:unnamed protein product [Cylicocyclus nassatus]